MEGEAKLTVQSLGDDGAAYAKALNYLKQTFGNSARFARAYIETITSGPEVCDKRHDIRSYHIAIRDALIILTRMNYDADVTSKETLRGVVARLLSRFRGKWAEKCSVIRATRIPQLCDLASWLVERVTAMFGPLLPDEHELSRQQKPAPKHVNVTQFTPKSDNATPVSSATSAVSIRTGTLLCPLCKGLYRTARCREYLGLSAAKRMDVITTHKLCVNCWNPRHRSRNCPSRNRCREDGCGRNHHTTVHGCPSLKTWLSSTNRQTRDGEPKESNLHTTDASRASPMSPCTTTTPSRPQPSSQLHMTVLPVRVTAPDGTPIETHAALETCSQVTLLREDIADKLKLPEPRLN